MLCRIKYKRDLRSYLKNTIIGNAKSFIDIGDGVAIPFSSDLPIKTKNQAYAIAKDKADYINNRYRADKYGNLASIDNTKNNGVIVNIHISEKLLDAYELKYRQIEAEEMIRRERERMGDITGEGQGEFYSVNIIKPGVKELFESNPELASVGTSKQYSEYLNTIFPDSKVKDIVYHNTPNKFDKFDKSFITFTSKNQKDTKSTDSSLGFFFTSDKDAYKGFVIEGNKLATVLNIKNPKLGGVNYSNLSLPYSERKRKVKDGSYEYWSDLKENLINKGFDGIKYGKAFMDFDEGGFTNPISEYIAFEPEQIHILGGKQDIEGFKKFVKNKSKLSPNDKIKNRLIEFARNNGIKVEFVDNLIRKGYNINGVYNVLNKAITIANNDEAMDTLIEEISHSVEDGLGKDDPLIKRLYELTNDVDFASELGEEYAKLYGEDREAMHKEYVGKIIKEGVSKASKQPSVIQRLINRIIDKFKSLFKKANISDLDKIKAEIDEIANELGNQVLSGNNMNFGYTSVTSVQPDNPMLFSIARKTKKGKSTAKILDDYQKQINVFNNRIKIINDGIRKNKDAILTDPTNVKKYKDRIDFLEKQLKTIQNKLSDYAKTKDVDTIIALGNNLLDGVEGYIQSLEQGKINIAKDRSGDLSYTMQVLDAFKELEGTSQKAINLSNRLDKINQQLSVQIVNELKGTSEEEYTIDELKVLGEDISSARGGFGALVDVGDVLARTIGTAIKRAQNTISVKNTELSKSIKDEVELLKKAQAARGVSEENMYDVFIQKYKGTTVFTKPYKSEFYEKIDSLFKDKNYKELNKLAYKDENTKQWVPVNKALYTNPNYTLIQKNAGLKRFYDFYDKTINEAQSKLPITPQKDFIPNIFRGAVTAIMNSERGFLGKLADGFKALTGINTYTILETDKINNEELFNDLVPLKYIQKLSAEDKTNNLGEALNKFATFAIAHEEMSDILPKVRLLQDMLKKKNYTKSSNPNISVLGDNTNLNKMINTVIDMQIKGKMKKDQGKFKIGDVYDEDGNVIGEKYKLASEFIDFGLKYNSLLRIGLNPINAVTNVAVGDIGNIVEGFGGRFYTLKNLNTATGIFFKENFVKDSKMNALLTKLNPLQELEDYSHTTEFKIGKKLTGDKVKELMYAPQRAGEKFLQTRTMIAMMHKQTITKPDGTGKVSLWEAFDKDGQLKKEYKNNFKTEAEYQQFIDKLTDKIQRVNQMIHGRYSERDAAAVQQNVLWRMAFQFKKWIPAAVEARFGEKQYDVRLDEEIEGRYRTAWRLMTKVLKGNLSALKAGNMSEMEIYNMRKNLSELVIMLGVVGLFFGLKWDDDDERKRNPYYKLTMNTLDRISGDMLFWFNPADATRTIKTPVPLIKTTSDMLNVLYLAPMAFTDEAIYKRGAYKGQSKLKVGIQKVVPGVNPITSVISNWSDAKYQEPQNF